MMLIGSTWMCGVRYVQPAAGSPCCNGQTPWSQGNGNSKARAGKKW